MHHRSWIMYEGALCRVGGIVNNPKKIKGIGIIIKEVNVDFGFGTNESEWLVLVGGSIMKLSTSVLWPI